MMTARELEERLGLAKFTITSYRSRYPDFPAPRGTDGPAFLYDVSEVEEWFSAREGDVVNRKSTIAGETIRCMECGKTMRALTGHLRRHGLTAAEYREKHQLPATAVLVAMPGRRTKSKSTPEHIRAQLTHDRQDEIRPRGVPGIRRAATLPIVEERRAPIRKHAHEARRRKAAARRDEVARAAGFEGCEDAVARTRHMSARAAAGLLDVGVSTIRRWRDLY